MGNRSKFRILHCLRAPVGGLFRHVCDLAVGQQMAGHEVAVVCASNGDRLTEERLAALERGIGLGVHRMDSRRNPGLADIAATRKVSALAHQLDIDVLHGHGAKGGAYARFATSAQAKPLAVYTPHGGSLHYGPTSLAGRAVSLLERRLERSTAGLIFESTYASDRYIAQIGQPRVPFRIIPNGVGPADFQPAVLDADATDILFVGELRKLKGIDVLLDALKLVAARRSVNATLVGGGPDADALARYAGSNGLGDCTRFTGPLPARQAFNMGRLLVLPSRAESFPYIVLEAGAAGVPQLLTRVGGIPEIVGDTGVPMLQPGNAEALATALFECLASPLALNGTAVRLKARVETLFTINTMTAAVLRFYSDLAALAALRNDDRRLAVAAG